MRRHWTSHLRLLPGGDSDPAVGLGVSLLLYGVSLIFGLIFGLVASSQIAMNDPNLAWVSSLSVANALPAALLGFWILRRLRSTQPIDADVVAVDLRRRRLYPGDEVGRAPQGALLLPARLTPSWPTARRSSCSTASTATPTNCCAWRACSRPRASRSKTGSASIWP